ncbi:MAG: MFS transporter [Deltaproteobacteria bacterium]|nr:MFS transporter [Deltaproteobacteria bacterium]
MKLFRNPLGVIFLTVMIDLLGWGIVIPILPTYAQRLGASGTTVGLLGTTFSAMQFLFSPAWGRLSDRVGRRRVIMVTAMGSVIAYVAYGLADSLWILFGARALGGLCAANISTAQAYIADVTTKETRARGMAIVGAGFGLGFVFGPAMSAMAAHHWGYRAPFFLAAGLAAINVAWAAIALPEPERRGSTARSERSLSDAMAIPNLAFYLMVFLVVTLGFANVESTFALWTSHELGFAEKQNAYLFTFIGIVLTSVQLLATRRLSARYGDAKLIVAGTALLGVGAMLLPMSTAWWQLLIPCALLASGNAVNSPSLMASISNSAPVDRQGEMLGVAQSVGAIGRIVGPGLGGFLFDHAGHAWPYRTAAVLMLGVSLAVTARSRRGRDTPTAR